jgi:DNA-binding HxlR family transcriptional regulator
MSGAVVNIGESQKQVLFLMSDLEWWTILEVFKLSTGMSPKSVECSLSRLYSRGFVIRRTAQGLPLHYQYRLSNTGLEAALEHYGSGAKA